MGVPNQCLSSLGLRYESYEKLGVCEDPKF